MKFIVGTLGISMMGMLLASCSGSESDAAAQVEMKKGFASRPSRDQLLPDQQKRFDAMKQMAETMAKNGPQIPGKTGP